MDAHDSVKASSQITVLNDRWQGIMDVVLCGRALYIRIKALLLVHLSFKYTLGLAWIGGAVLWNVPVFGMWALLRLAAAQLVLSLALLFPPATEVLAATQPFPANFLPSVLSDPIVKRVNQLRGFLGGVLCVVVIYFTHPEDDSSTDSGAVEVARLVVLSVVLVLLCLAGLESAHRAVPVWLAVIAILAAHLASLHASLSAVDNPPNVLWAWVVPLVGGIVVWLLSHLLGRYLGHKELSLSHDDLQHKDSEGFLNSGALLQPNQPSASPDHQHRIILNSPSPQPSSEVEKHSSNSVSVEIKQSGSSFEGVSERGSSSSLLATAAGQGGIYRSSSQPIHNAVLINSGSSQISTLGSSSESLISSSDKTHLHQSSVSNVKSAGAKPAMPLFTSDSEASSEEDGPFSLSLPSTPAQRLSHARNSPRHLSSRIPSFPSLKMEDTE